MKCSVKDCYWNMWTPNHKMLCGEDSMVCVSESFEEHCDPNDDFKLTPNTNKCEGYLSYLKFCGVEKGTK